MYAQYAKRQQGDLPIHSAKGAEQENSPPFNFVFPPQHFLSFTLISAVLCINHTLFCTYWCKFTLFPFVFKNIFVKKLAKGWGDVLSLHLQTGLRAAFHSVFHALLRHCIPYISPNTFPLFARNLGEERCKDNIPLPWFLAKNAPILIALCPKRQCISMRYALPPRAFFRFKSHQTILQNCHFCIAKLPLLQRKTHHFRMQYAPF